MASERSISPQSRHSLWLKLLEQEVLPPENLSPRKMNSSPRSSLDMILEREEEETCDVTLGVIPESEEETLEAQTLAAATAGKAGVKGQGSREQQTQAGESAAAGSEEEELEGCLPALASGTLEWASVRHRAADLYCYAARLPLDLVRAKSGPLLAPLPRIPEAEECHSSAPWEPQASSAPAKLQLRRVYSEPYPPTEVRWSRAFETTLATVFEVEEQFLVPDLGPSCNNRQPRSKRFAAVYPSFTPRSCAGHVPSLPPAVEAREEAPHGPERHLTVYPCDLLQSRQTQEQRKCRLTSVTEAAEEVTGEGVPQGLQWPRGRSGLLQSCSWQFSEHAARKRAVSVKDALRMGLLA